MKSSLLFIMIMFPIVMINSVRAELDPDKTEQSFIRDEFCGPSGAPKVIEKLNLADIERTKEIAELTKNINSLKANQVLINGFLKIRDDFTKSYSAIATDNSNKDENLARNLDNFKTLLKSSLSLNAVNMLIQADPKAAESNSVFELCKNAKSNFCDHINGLTIKSNLRPEIAQLNETIKNVNAALSRSSDQEAVKRDLSAIYNSIPSPISPDKVLADLLKGSPQLVELLEKSPNKEVISGCLKNMSNESCSEILNNSSTREELKNILTYEMLESQKTITKDKLNKVFSDHDFSGPKNKKDVTELMNKKANEASDFLEKQISENNKLGFDKANLDDFRNVCVQKENKVFDKNACATLANKMVSYFEKLNKETDNKIKADLKKIETLTNNKTDFDGIQKMQQYVAEKYIRICPDAKESDLNLTNCSIINTDAQDPANTGSVIGTLNQSVSNVVGSLKNKFSISSQRGELGPFSKSELRTYKRACESLTVRKVAQDVCADISKEEKKISNQKESSEWEAFNKDYWTEKSASGYVTRKKKSSAQIFGEALAQNANKFLPMLLGNMQFRSQIDIMTNQALSMKQFNYMNDPTSPWMTNYFPGNYYSIPTVLNTGAFNFAK